MSIKTQMTALADAIRVKSGVEGKLSLDGMTQAVNSITVGDGIDTSDATATASDISVGKTAYIMGERVVGTMPDSEITIEDNIVTVTAGRVVENATATIPEMTITNDGENITVPVGYNKTEQTFTVSADYYKCAAVHGPRKVTYINVSGAGTAAVNGDYEKTSFTSGTGGEVWKHRTADYYYYEYDGYLCIHSDYNTSGESALYYTGNGNEWYPGYDYDTDAQTGASPAPTVSQKQVTLDADVPKTWDGYKAVLVDGLYTFSETLTTGLVYGSGFTPVAGTIYDSNCLTKAVLWQGTLFKLDANTIAYIDFDNGDVADVSGHAVTKEGGTFTPDGYYSGAWDFQSGYLQIVPEADEFVIGTGDFTFEAYIRPTSTARQCLFAYEQDGIFSVCFSYHGGPNLAIFWRGEWRDHQISGELSMNVWQHVAFVRKAGIFSCFVNGVKQSQTYDLSSVSVGESGQKFGIGRWGGDPGDFGARWVSCMDEIRISNVARYTDNFIPA